MISFLAKKVGPIGLDIGYNSIKMLQFAQNNGQIRVAAAEKVQFKSDLGDDADARKDFIVKSIRDAIRRGQFSGTKVVSCIPNDNIKIRSLRLDPTEIENVEQLVKDELAERFEYNPDRDEIRYITAGKVYNGSEIKNEVIFFATDRATIENHITLLEEAGLAPDGIDPVPCSLIRSFQRSMRRQADQARIRSFIDVGDLYTTVIIGSCDQIYFIKQIPSGGKNLNEHVSSKLGIGIEESVLLRSKIQHGNTDTINESVIRSVNDAISQGVEELIREISLCFKYCAVTFRGHHPEEIILTGGEAYESVFTEALAATLNLEVNIARPLQGVELSGSSYVWDQGSELCEWAVAAGLGYKNWQVNNYAGANNE